VRRLPLLVLLVVGLAGCSGSRSRVIDDTGEFPRHRCIGVAPFVDSRGQGQAVADLIEGGLQQLMYEPVDEKALAKVLADNAPERGVGLGIEALEKIHAKVPADAIVFGRIAPDWSFVQVTVTETEMGGPIAQLLLRPRGRHRKAFADPAEIAREALRVLTSLR
jgi:hypothetical protein